jgi:hypothetical protein
MREKRGIQIFDHISRGYTNRHPNSFRVPLQIRGGFVAAAPRPDDRGRPSPPCQWRGSARFDFRMAVDLWANRGSYGFPAMRKTMG